jgi:hypothetical protein
MMTPTPAERRAAFVRSAAFGRWRRDGVHGRMRTVTALAGPHVRPRPWLPTCSAPAPHGWGWVTT